jgi:leader peptidase (prepilin peptidase)/N-methyltransferase
MLVPLWLILVFVVGIVWGSFVNVWIARLPLEKSILWPGSRCGICFQRIRWYDNIPLVSYLWLRGRCRVCGARFSIRYFLVELFTGLGFAGLFYLEVVLNVHNWRVPAHSPFDVEMGVFPWQWWVACAFHAFGLFSFLLAVSVCDLASREIPLSLTVSGTVVGLIGAVLLAWPWPYTPEEELGQIQRWQEAAKARPAIQGMTLPSGGWWDMPHGMLKEALYPWPVWGPLPEWLGRGGDWTTGLATGLAGALFGTLLMRAVAFLFGAGLGKEALGLGDADLMMMAGSFLGWQPVLVAFLVSVVPALFFGMFQLVVRRDNSLPFGPSLAAGVLATMLGWHWIGPRVQPLFFWPMVLGALAVVGGAFLLLSSYLLRLTRRRGETVDDTANNHR